MRGNLWLVISFAGATGNFIWHVKGFTAQGPFAARKTARDFSSTVTLWLTPEEERAAVLSNYLAKSHDEKLKAIETVERKKDAEIQELKEELEGIRSGGGSTAITTTTVPTVSEQDLAGLSKEELISRVSSYQQFMAKYIINAQEEKAKALRAAEEAIAKKYDTRLLQLSGQSQVVSSAAPVLADKQDDLYLQRNARVSAAAAAGQSRWGNREVERVAQVNIQATPAAAVNGATAPTSASVVVPPEVTAADHGLRNDGGVGGLTLAERVAKGAGSANGAPVTQTSQAHSFSKNELLFQQRNAMVAAAAKAGKSRWGSMEIEKIQTLGVGSLLNGAVSSAVSSTAEVAAADHGLRADGGVGGPSLAARVNLGAQLLGSP